MSTYQHLQHKFSEQMDEHNSQKRRAASIIGKAIEALASDHGIPRTNISCFPLLDDLSEDAGKPPSWVIEQKPTGTWGLNLQIRVDSPSEGGGYVVCLVRPEVQIKGPNIELGLNDEAGWIPLGDFPGAEDASIRSFAGRIVDVVVSAVEDLGKPEEGRERVMGFHPGTT